jgi:uncharacterized protein YeaO (DUF488 family)
MITIKRVYEPREPGDGYRVLVERLWPRGLSKERAAVDLWLKEVAPSPELRRWFGHRPQRWVEFRRRYRDELRYRPGELLELRELALRGPLTLVYASRDETHNAARVLKELMDEEAGGAAAAA